MTTLTKVAREMLEHGCAGDCPARWELDRALTYYQSALTDHARARLANACRDFANENSKGYSMRWSYQSSQWLEAVN